jgi:hypothetical protein
VVFAVGEEDDAAEDHVYACCIEGGRDEQEEGLHDVGTERPIGRLGGGHGPLGRNGSG